MDAAGGAEGRLKNGARGDGVVRKHIVKTAADLKRGKSKWL